jgi:alpha-glucosidase
VDELKVGTLWLFPVYSSPMVDFGYDISNFFDIDPLFGTLANFKTLITSMKGRGEP